MKKVLWVSRHPMTDAQEGALGQDIVITQVSKTLQSAYELKNEIDEADIIAIVAPISLQQQFLKLAAGKPVIMAVSERILVPDEDGGEDKVQFVFQKWEQLDRIEVVKHDFVPEP